MFQLPVDTFRTKQIRFSGGDLTLSEITGSQRMLLTSLLRHLGKDDEEVELSSYWACLIAVSLWEGGRYVFDNSRQRFDLEPFPWPWTFTPKNLATRSTIVPPTEQNTESSKLPEAQAAYFQDHLDLYKETCALVQKGLLVPSESYDALFPSFQLLEAVHLILTQWNFDHFKEAYQWCEEANGLSSMEDERKEGETQDEYEARLAAKKSSTNPDSGTG